MKTRHSCTLLLAAVLCCCAVLVAEGSPARLVQFVNQPEPDDDFVPVEQKTVKADDDEAEEYRFLTATGTATASAINNLITREQQALEKLRPTKTSSSSSLYSTGTYGYGSGYGSGYTSSGSNVVYLNSGTSTSSTYGTTSGITPTIIYAGRRKTRRPGNRNRNRNRNRKRNGGAQVFVVRPQ